jgi:hypothetical protein
MSGEAQFHEKKLLVASVARSLDLIDDAALDKQRDRVANRQLSAESAAMLRARPATDARNLRDLLMPIALQSNESSAIAKNAWFPYVAASLRLAVHHLETMGTAAADALWNEMESVTVWPNVHSSFVSLLLSHAAALIDAKRPILQFLQDSSKFVSLCANRYDRSLVLQALNGHVNETILGGLLRQSETSTGLSCCETLKSMLVDYGYWKRMDHVMALDSGASTTSVVLRLVGSLELLVRDVAARVADEIDALVATVIDIVTALVDLTAQAPTGRFLSWWITHRSCKPTSSRCDALGWLGWLQRATSVAPFHSRQLACLVVRLECNVVPFLARPRSSSAPAAPYPAFAALSAPEAHQARWALLASLLGTDAALPDAQYIADLVAQRLHVPKLGVHFLDVDDYCARHLALYKAHVCWQLWQELTESGAGAGDEQQSVFAIDEIGHLRADDAMTDARLR